MGRTEAPSRKPDSPKPILTPLEILKSGEITQRDETILIKRITPEFDLVDDSHAVELGSNIQTNPRGQTSRITVRARLVGDSGIVYDIIDGFHRTEGRRKNGEKEIDAVVLYACDDEELFDQRVLAASSVRAVQYPRIAQWISSSYAQTQFAERGIPVEKAFSIVARNVKRPQGIDITEEEIEELREYVRSKCNHWNRSVNVVADILQTVSNADPELVKKVRDKGGGKDRTNKITPEKLKAVVNAFPGEENFPIQRAILDLIVEGRMFATYVPYFVEDLKQKAGPDAPTEHVIETARAIFPEHLKLEEEMTKGGPKKKTDTENTGHTDDKGPMVNGRRGRKGQIHSTTPTETIEDVREELRLTREQLEAALSGKGKKADRWWMRASYLTDEERQIWDRLLFGKESLANVARDLGVGDNQILTFIKSSLLKRELHRPKPDPSTK